MLDNEAFNTFIDGLINSMMDNSVIDSKTILIKDGYLNIANSMWSYFNIIAIGMLLIYFLLEVNQKLAIEGRDLTLKSFFGPFLKLAIAIAVVSQGARIVSAIIELSNDFVTQSDANGSIGVNTNNLLSQNEWIHGADAYAVFETFAKTQMGFMERILLAVFMLIAWVITQVLGLVWAYKSILYKIEFIFRVGVTPIALADTYNGMNSHAIKWLKGLLAMGIYGMAFLIIPKLGYNLLMADVVNVYENQLNTIKGAANGTLSVNDYMSAGISNGWSLLWILISFIVVPFAEIGCLSLCRQVSKELLS